MRLRGVFSISLSLLLVVPPAGLWATPAGAIEGVVTLSDRPLSGQRLAFIDLSTGAVTRATSGRRGQFKASVAPGRYLVAAESTAGLTVERDRAYVNVSSGQATTTRVALMAVAGAAVLQEPAEQIPPEVLPGAGPTVIEHDPIECFVAGEFPLIPARIEPASQVVRARVYFRSALSPEWYYIEMGPGDAANFVGKLPKPQMDASPITYYAQAATTAGGDAQTPEIAAIVVEQEEDCKDRALAAFGPPGDVTVFSAATGAAVKPVGFAVGGLALGALLLLIGGAAALAIAAAVDVFDDPSPSPSPQPTPTPTPTPTPSPSPSPTPTPQPSPTATPPPGTPVR